jgi:hypothetical protein
MLNLLPTFPYPNAGERLEAPHPYLSTQQLQPPSFPMVPAGLTSLPLSMPMPPSSLQGFSRHPLLPGPAKYGTGLAAWRDSDDFMQAAVESERRRLVHMRTAMIGKHHNHMATTPNEAQTRQALMALLQEQQQQQPHPQLPGSYFSHMQSMQPMQHVAPQVVAPLPSAGPSKFAYRAENPADSSKVFKVLGSSLRGKTDRYIDISELPVIPGEKRQSIRGGVAEPFPEKLYFMLQDVAKEGKSHIISFYPHGRAFAILDMEAFADEILPKYFAKQGKLVSFVRQINLYGFARIHSGPDAGGYYHELFLKGRPELFSYMRRAGASKGKEDRRKRKDRHLPVLQPDFYAMKPIRPVPPPPTL